VEGAGVNRGGGSKEIIVNDAANVAAYKGGAMNLMRGGDIAMSKD